MLRILLLTCLAVPLPAYTQLHSSDYTEPYQQLALTIYRDTIAMRTAEGQNLVPKMAF